MFADQTAPPIFAAAHVRDEVVEWLPQLARKRKLDLGLLLAVFQSLPIQWTGGDSYGKFEEDARRRMAVRDEEDWLTVALALTLTERHNVAVWSQDKDFSVSSLDVLTTGDLLELLAGRE
ncbi:MAG: PIN domain-containing protein [Candidatus Dormibacteraeota bacterium]|nr:PIN domain-containing protein [Candidatus Dormibacteraeota bacterium]